jgi:hypothetical protein
MLPPLLRLPLADASAVDSLAVDLSRLLRPDAADVDVNTGKRKVDGSRAATRIGATTTERWANERFRQVMLLVLEFRLNWPNMSLLTNDDFEAIRVAIDNALYTATRSGHTGDIYDLNPTVWAIWMVQRAHALKMGSWTVESVGAQTSLTFESLYLWLESRHSLRERKDLRHAVTNKTLHRYVLPFKAMRVPPAPENLFKFKKGGRRLSNWLETGSGGDSSQGLPFGIYALKPAELVAPPAGGAARDARATAVWNRVREAARSRARAPLRSVNANTEDGEDTSNILNAVMHASREADANQSAPEGQGGASSTDPDGTVDPPEQPSTATSDRGDTSRGGTDSIDTPRQEGQEHGSDRGERARAPPPPSGLSEVEEQRLRNIARNKQRLRELGLEPEEEDAPPPRAPRQPRPPPGPPTRASERVRGSRHSYSEADADREFERQLAVEDELQDAGEDLTLGEIDDILDEFQRETDGGRE